MHADIWGGPRFPKDDRVRFPHLLWKRQPPPPQDADDEETIKAAYMTLPPSLGVPSIADSCFSCFDYTNGLADLVVGYMGAPFDAKSGNEMTTAPLMVTVRNARGRAMLDAAIAAGLVEILQDGGHGGAGLPSSGDRRTTTLSTLTRDSLVQVGATHVSCPAHVRVCAR